MGRQDSLVKIRGHRVDLTEIESIFHSHPYIDNAVVKFMMLVRSGSFIAYYTLNSMSESIDIQDWLFRKLPSYMVPARCIWLEHFPRNSNGKMDIKLLPLPQKLKSKVQIMNPQELQIEKQLVALWEEILGISPIGINDNFL